VGKDINKMQLKVSNLHLNDNFKSLTFLADFGSPEM